MIALPSEWSHIFNYVALDTIGPVIVMSAKQNSTLSRLA